MAYVNPFKKWYCFSCGQEVQLGLCDIYNWETGKEVRKAPTGWWARLRSRFFIETLDGPFYVTNFACRKCPNCQKLLPRDMETARNIVIAVLGDVTVGKTHYIAACIDQMSLGGPLRHLDEVEECLALNQNVAQRYSSTLHDPVFTNRTPLPATQSIKLARTEEEKLSDPLIYRLKVRKAPFLPLKVYNLIFYDASGEDLADQTTLVKYKSYALDPDAIIYIADPLTIPSIEERTPYKSQSKKEPDFVLRWTIDLVRPYKRLRGDSLTIPIAITLSKSDLLAYLEPEDTPFSFLGESNYVGGFDMDDIKCVSREVQELLDKYGAQGLRNTYRLSEHVSFFATSATGCAPNPDTGKFDVVQPRRCLDPLLWILFTLGVINKKADNAFTGPSQDNKWGK